MSTALVTGGSRGIGRAIALRLAEDGHDVAVGYAQREEQAEQVAAQVRGLGRRAISVSGDLSEPGAAEQLFDRVEQELSAVDVLIANAGIARAPSGTSRSHRAWERMLAVNLTAPFLVARRAFGMCERGFARIVFISSVAAACGGLIGAHAASRPACTAGSQPRPAGVGRGVTVNVVAPALIETDAGSAELRKQSRHRARGRLRRSSR
jgi:3-oxoacyl-[acyl-carrier protein] reductase